MNRLAIIGGGLLLGVTTSKAIQHYQDLPKESTWAKFKNDLVETKTVDHIEYYKGKAYIYKKKFQGSTELNPKENYFISCGEDIKEKIRTIEEVSEIPREEYLNVFETERTNWSEFLLMTIPLIVTPIMFSLGNKMKMRQQQKEAMEKMMNQSKTKFKDIAGMTNSKIEIEEFVHFLKDKKKFDKVGARIPKGALLTGPPGTGKTLLAKAVAGEAGVPFISIAGSSFMEMYVGVGSSRVRTLFSEARKKAPCIIFIDEIDAIGKKRGSSFGNDERDSTLNQLLVEMDGFNSDKTVIVLGATNRANILDPALLRPGRFDRQIEIDLPSKDERAEIFDIYLPKITPADNICSGLLAEKTPGFSGADISNLCNEAAIMAGRDEVSEINLDHFDQALDRLTAGIISSRKMSPTEEKLIAYHEAGHAVVGHVLEKMGDVIKISIVPRSKGSLGFTQYFKEESVLLNKEELQDHICILLAGRESEKIFMNQITTGAADDLDRAKSIIKNMINIFGMGTNVELTETEMNQEINLILEQAADKASQILVKNKSCIEMLTQLLLDKKTINKKEIDDIFLSSLNK